jgi:hypothetical protein
VGWPFCDRDNLYARSIRQPVGSRWLDDVAERVAVIRVVRQRLACVGRTGASVGGHDRAFDAELVRRRGVALADAIDLGGMEGIELPSALTLLLGSGGCRG